MKQREYEAKESFLHLEKLVVLQRHSTKRPLWKTFQQYQEKKGSPIKNNCNSEIQRKFDLEVMAFFKHFVAVTVPQYNIRSSHTMSKRMTGLLYKNLEKAMEFVFETELPDCLNVAFTYSEWT